MLFVVVIFSQFFEIIIVCFVAICDLVHNMESAFHLQVC